MGLSQHPHTHFIQARIAQRNGRIAVKEQTINLLSLFQAGQSAILPENRRYIGNRAQKALMAASEGSVAQLQTFLQNLPLFIHIALAGTGYIHQINGHYALIETAVVFVASICISLGILNRQKGAAAHAGVYIPLF